MGMLRLLLALAVVVAHASPPAGFSFLEMTGGPLAVQIFYEISGFYMAMILSNRYVGEGATAAFYKNRFLRLYPVFAVVLFVSAALFAALHFYAGYDAPPLATWLKHREHLSPLGWLLLGLSNLTIIGEDWVSFIAVNANTGGLYFNPDLHAAQVAGWQFLFVPQAWTVAVELTFYAVAPLLVRTRLPVAASILFGSLVLRAAIMRGFGLWNDPWTFRFFPTELALFLAGVFSYRLYRYREAHRRLVDARLDVIVTGIALALILLYTLLPHAFTTARYGLEPILAFFPFAFPFMFAATRINKLDRAIGELSYPVYMVHFAVVFAIPAFSKPWIVQNHSWLIIGQSLVYAMFLQRFIAAPLERTRERISHAIPHPPPPQSLSARSANAEALSGTD